MEIPVTVHEQALEELLPVRREIKDVLCKSLPMSGEVDLPELHMCFLGMCTGTKEAVGAVNTFGENIAQWRRHSDTRQLVDSAWKCAWKFQYLATLRHDPLLMKAEYDARQVLLAVIDRILREVLDWIECYENIVRHPEAWQGKDAHLMLVIEAEKELDDLHRLLEQRGYVLNDGILLPNTLLNSKKGFGLISLLAAFGLGMWVDGDD